MLVETITLFTSIVIIMHTAGAILWKAVEPTKQDKQPQELLNKQQEHRIDYGIAHASNLSKPTKNHSQIDFTKIRRHQ